MQGFLAAQARAMAGDAEALSGGRPGCQPRPLSGGYPARVVKPLRALCRDFVVDRLYSKTKPPICL